MFLLTCGCGEVSVCGVVVTLGSGWIFFGGNGYLGVLARFETMTNPPRVSSEITNTIAVALFVNVFTSCKTRKCELHAYNLKNAILTDQRLKQASKPYSEGSFTLRKIAKNAQLSKW